MPANKFPGPRWDHKKRKWLFRVREQYRSLRCRGSGMGNCNYKKEFVVVVSDKGKYMVPGVAVVVCF